jgi:hypothetical protein
LPLGHISFRHDKEREEDIRDDRYDYTILLAYGMELEAATVKQDEARRLS